MCEITGTGGRKHEYFIFLTPKKEVACLPADDTLRQAMERMKYHGYTAVPLLTKEGKYAGTITEGDILRAMETLCHWDIFQAEKIKIKDVPKKGTIKRLISVQIWMIWWM